MNYHKGFTAATALLIVLGILVLGGIGYIVIKPQPLQAPVSNDLEITWRFANAGEIDAMPYTKVSVTVYGKTYEVGSFVGSCSEIGASGGIDGKGLLAGELSAVQCWFAGSGDEVGVFAHEDGGFQIMVGELSEGEDGMGMFRGNFTIKTDIKP